MPICPADYVFFIWQHTTNNNQRTMPFHLERRLFNAEIIFKEIIFIIAVVSIFIRDRVQHLKIHVRVQLTYG